MSGPKFDYSAQAQSTDASAKPSNPKDQAQVTRPNFGAPLLGLIDAACKRYEGALKYGTWNYLICGVRSSVYAAAILRHTLRWIWGEDYERIQDPKTGEWIQGVHHMGGVIESANILREAQHRGILTDDRPPAMSSADMDAAFKYAEETMQRLFRVFGHIKPRDYTIADMPPSGDKGAESPSVGKWENRCLRGCGRNLGPYEECKCDGPPPPANQYTPEELQRMSGLGIGLDVMTHKCERCPALLRTPGVCDTCTSADRVVNRATNRIEQG